MNCELLAPAGSYDIAIAALNMGADAIYLATEKFGARAYAKNLTLNELEKVVNYANVLGKKIYVTCNTLIKDSELEDVYTYLDTIYQLGVHGVITTDFAVINYVINCLPAMECHISTQVGVKNLEDVNFFTELGAKRTVLARETALTEIKRIKANSKMPLEVFIHGALCVSYSGNCFFSSLLTLRSGNRGRCAQNCRREYLMLRDGKEIAPKANYLSMKDLNTFASINELVNLGVDSFKIEGRMKDVDYVKALAYTYRQKIDNPNYETNILNKVFHRTYTAGFLKNADNGDIVSSTRSGNVGEYVGEISFFQKGLFKVNLKNKIELNNRVRITADKDYYFDITKIFNKQKQSVSSLVGEGFIQLDVNLTGKYKLYIIKNRNITFKDPTKIPLNIYLSIKDNDLLLAASYDELYFSLTFSNILQDAKTSGTKKEDLIKQLTKLNDTPFYLDNCEIDDKIVNKFMPVSQMNQIRRSLLENIYNTLKGERLIKPLVKPKLVPNNDRKELICFCHTKEQFDIAKELGIKAYYQSNYLNYTSVAKLTESDILVSNFGSIYLNKNHELTLNKEFNVLNHDSLAYFLQYAKHVTLSEELSFNEIKNLITSFYSEYGFYPSADLIIYGHMTLMTTKYCPIKHIGHCPECKTHHFALQDDSATFPLIHDGCITSILNEKATNLIDEITKLYPYINRFRLDFTIESAGEVKEILLKAQNKLTTLRQTNYFDAKKETRAYYKREIL